MRRSTPPAEETGCQTLVPCFAAAWLRARGEGFGLTIPIGFGLQFIQCTPQTTHANSKVVSITFYHGNSQCFDASNEVNQPWEVRESDRLAARKSATKTLVITIQRTMYKLRVAPAVAVELG